jgi:hypothetical protein
MPKSPQAVSRLQFRSGMTDSENESAIRFIICHRSALIPGNADPTKQELLNFLVSKGYSLDKLNAAEARMVASGEIEEV